MYLHIPSICASTSLRVGGVMIITCILQVNVAIYVHCFFFSKVVHSDSIIQVHVLLHVPLTCTYMHGTQVSCTTLSHYISSPILVSMKGTKVLDPWRSGHVFHGFTHRLVATCTHAVHIRSYLRLRMH